MLMGTTDLVQLLVLFFFFFVIDGEMRPKIGEKDLSRVTQLSGAKLESKPGILTCSLFHAVTGDCLGTILFLVLLQSDS